MCSGRRCGSTDMQHDLFGDLDLRSNFQHDLSRSNYISFNAAWQEKHDTGKRNVVALLSQKLLQKKNVYRKNSYFWSFCYLEAKPLILDQTWGHISERAFKELSALLRSTVALSRVMRQFVEKCWNRPNLTFADLWWPDLSPDQKKWPW